MITSKSVKFGYLCNDIITLRTVDYEIQENTQCDIKNQEEGYGTFFLIAFSDLAGTLTQDLRNRNPTLYTTKLRGLIEGGPLIRLLHALLEMIHQLAEEVVAGVATVDGVVAVGVGELAEVLVGMHEGFGVFCHIAVVDVVVGRTMDDEQASAQVLGT